MTGESLPDHEILNATQPEQFLTVCKTIIILDRLYYYYYNIIIYGINK
jgi:hypothetical protein